MALNPKILRVSLNAESGMLEVVVSRDVTDVMNPAITRRDDTVTGPLNTLAGLAVLRNNLIAWVKAQSGYAGNVDIA